MKIAHISPTAYLDVTLGETDFQLALADQIVSNDEYRKFYQMCRARGDFVMMDVPAFEGEDIDAETLLEAISLLSPNEVSLPDAYTTRDARKTVEQAEDASDIIRRETGMNSFVAYPRGQTLNDYRRCAWLLAQVEGVKTLAVVEEIEEWFGISRAELSYELRTQTGLDIHYAGVQDDLADLADDVIGIRSADTAKFVVWGLNGYRVGYPPHVPYPGRKSLGGRQEYFDYKDAKLNEIRDAIYNVMKWREI